MANLWSSKFWVTALLLFCLALPAGAVKRPVVYQDSALPMTTVALLFQYGYMDEMEQETGLCQLYLAYMRRLAYEHNWVVDCRYLLQPRASLFILTLRNSDLTRLAGLYRELLTRPLARQDLLAELGPLLADADSKAIRGARLPYLVSLMKRYLFYPLPAARMAYNPRAYDQLADHRFNTWLPLYFSCLHSIVCYTGNRQQAAEQLEQLPVHSFPACPAREIFSWQMTKTTEELALPVPGDTRLYGVIFSLRDASDRWLIALLQHYISHDLQLPNQLEWVGNKAILYIDLPAGNALAGLLDQQPDTPFWPRTSDWLANSYTCWRLETLVNRHDPLSWLQWLADTAITAKEAGAPPAWPDLRERIGTDPPHLAVYVLQVKGVDL